MPCIDPAKCKRNRMLFLSRENLCLNEECFTLGLAQTGSMCSPYSYTVVQDIGLSSGYHIAHEIGHLCVLYSFCFSKKKKELEYGTNDHHFYILFSLGALHDNRPECSPYQNSDQTHLMASALHIGTHMWSWSPCSRHFITEFLELNSNSKKFFKYLRNIFIKTNLYFCIHLGKIKHFVY